MIKKYKAQYGNGILMNGCTHRVQAITVDNQERTLNFAIIKGGQIEQFNITMEEAQLIGFIDFSKISYFLR